MGGSARVMDALAQNLTKHINEPVSKIPQIHSHSCGEVFRGKGLQAHDFEKVFLKGDERVTAMLRLAQKTLPSSGKEVCMKFAFFEDEPDHSIKDKPVNQWPTHQRCGLMVAVAVAQSSESPGFDLVLSVTQHRQNPDFHACHLLCQQEEQKSRCRTLKMVLRGLAATVTAGGIGVGAAFLLPVGGIVLGGLAAACVLIGWGYAEHKGCFEDGGADAKTIENSKEDMLSKYTGPMMVDFRQPVKSEENVLSKYTGPMMVDFSQPEIFNQLCAGAQIP